METMAACKARVAHELTTIIPAREPRAALYDLMCATRHEKARACVRR